MKPLGKKRDRLETLLKLQRMFMDSLMITKDDVASDEFLSTVIGLNTEAVEILDLLNVRTRPWGVGENGVISKRRVIEEAIDVLFYLLEIFNQLRLDADAVYREYGKKLIVNLSRAFAAHAPTVEERHRAYAEFTAEADKYDSTMLALLDISSLSVALEELFGVDNDVEFFDEDFFINPVEKAKQWVAKYEPVSAMRTV